MWFGTEQVRRPEVLCSFSLSNHLLINIASIASMPGAPGEENEATPSKASMILDEWGVTQGISRAERADLIPGAAAAA